MEEALDPDAMRFFTAGATGAYLIKHCAACGTASQPAAIVCRKCASDRLEFVEASGDAVLVACTRARRSFDPANQSLLPYDVGIARLAEGPLAIGRVLGFADALPEPGTPLRIRFEKMAGRAVPAFSAANREYLA